MNIACARCGTLGLLKAMDDDVEEIENVTNIDTSDGMIQFICKECMTDEEVTTKARQSAVALLDAAEEMVSNMEMIFERVPGMKDDPDSKQAYAEAQEHAERARATLTALDRADES